eukprot:CAMPEP_0180610654 /NCGR_PEP_ID=MMETSP1037_2-20121125/29385_1 /TAXON_ID=632150 /ORGANISM="Azadinium spinosum, Strain 3D9" /LENGTH=42 /DNA_ID= /DNA_START= /DNA_END= /DNA_ORIENTATION=
MHPSAPRTQAQQQLKAQIIAIQEASDSFVPPSPGTCTPAGGA